MPNVTDVLTNQEVSTQRLSFENPETLVNICVGTQTFVDPQVATISVSLPSCPADGTTDVVTVTILDNMLNGIGGRTIKLHTKPSGGVGDNTTAITGSNGQAVFNVNSTRVGYIIYSFTDVSN